MSNLDRLSENQVVLLASKYISDVDVESLQILASERKDVLTRDLIYRLLLTLYPSSETARSALLSLLRSVHADFVNISDLDTQIDLSSVTSLSPAAASKLVSQLYLIPIKDGGPPSTDDHVSDFVIAWSHHVERAGGGLDDLLPIVDQCMLESHALQTWATSYLLPIVRLCYSYYVGEGTPLTLHQIESASGLAGVSLLLQFAERQSTNAQIARDLDEVVSPWVEGTKGVDGVGKASWAHVYEWIIKTSLRDFRLATKTLLEWDGPPSLREFSSSVESKSLDAFVQTAFAVLYANNSPSQETLNASRKIFDRVAIMVGKQPLETPAPVVEISGIMSAVDEASDASLLQNSLLSSDNTLTRPSESSIMFLRGVLETANVLVQYNLPQSPAEITRACISGSEEHQTQELRRILQQVPRIPAKDLDWSDVRQHLLWLRSWRGSLLDEATKPTSGPFLGNLAKETVEKSLFNSIVTAGQYEAAKEIYLGTAQRPLDLVMVESLVVDALFSAYDNASNGNRSRGGLKRATEVLQAFRTSFPDSQKLRNIEHLLKATHSLSFYQLTLQHGVPFRPVNIRVHEDPIELVSRVLEQDPKAYTKLDDLLEIGRNLVLAGLHDGHQDISKQLLEADRRITYLAITSSLAAHDFDTAYSYITTRLSMSDSERATDDYSWRAAYAAGRYRPVNPPKDLHARIASLSKRMDLLSLSLTLATQPNSLSEILGQWRRCEEEMDVLKQQALEAERAVGNQVDETMPGGFGMQDDEMDATETQQALAKRNLGLSSGTYEDEAPLGLFDVAKGAANALRRSAFPLNAGSMKDLKIKDAHSRQGSDQSVPSSPFADDGSGRVRKRDMVSNMVTSGLVSGMGWVLGAEPVSKSKPEDD